MRAEDLLDPAPEPGAVAIGDHAVVEATDDQGGPPEDHLARLLPEAVDDRQHLSHPAPSGSGQGPHVAQETRPLGSGEVGKRRRQLAERRLVVAGPVEPGRARVPEHPRDLGRELDLLRPPPEDPALLPARPAQDDRHLPRRSLPRTARATGGVAVEALLGQAHRGLGPLEVQEGEPGPGDPRLEQGGDRAVRRRLQGGPQVLARRAAVGMTCEVVADPPLHHVGTEKALDHPEHARTLLVGDGVEGLHDLLDALRAVPDGVGAGERVELVGARLLVLEAGPDPPRGEELVEDPVGHPGREALVEPQVRPPGRGHEVPEPLVGQLVGDHVREIPELSDRDRGRIGEEQGLAVGHTARVLHRPRREVGNRDVVALPEGVRDPEVVLQGGLGRAGELESRVGELDAAPGGDHPDRDPPDVVGLGLLPRPRAQRDQVGGQGARALEVVRHPPRARSVHLRTGSFE